jgi:hypothetical protein
MALKATRKSAKSAVTAADSDSFVYRGVRIKRTWMNSNRKKKIGEAMQTIIQRGPEKASAN